MGVPRPADGASVDRAQDARGGGRAAARGHEGAGLPSRSDPASKAMTDVPDEVRALAAEREERRKAKDFARADTLRERIARTGLHRDRRAGGDLARARGGSKRRAERAAHDVESVLDGPADGGRERALGGRGMARGRGPRPRWRSGRMTGGATCSTSSPTSRRRTRPHTATEVEVLALEPGTGWGAARNAGLKRSRGRIVLAVDGSVEPTGDVFGPIEAALGDPAVGVCGPFGISTEDLREFHESDGGRRSTRSRAT